VYVKDLHEVQNLDRLKAEQQVMSQHKHGSNAPPMDLSKFETCMVCGDKASGGYRL
jgi:hypothetical protein